MGAELVPDYWIGYDLLNQMVIYNSNTNWNYQFDYWFGNWLPNWILSNYQFNHWLSIQLPITDFNLVPNAILTPSPEHNSTGFKIILSQDPSRLCPVSQPISLLLQDHVLSRTLLAQRVLHPRRCQHWPVSLVLGVPFQDHCLSCHQDQQDQDLNINQLLNTE